MLEVRGLTARYSGDPVVRDVSFSVEAGKVATIIGSNGAGKTTTLRSTVGALRIVSGEVWVDGEKVTSHKPREMLRRGVALVPEGRGIFKGLTVLENLRLGGYTKGKRSEVEQQTEAALELFPRLNDRLKVSAGMLSGGEQQMLAIARALISQPRYLLLDEPSMGLAPSVVKDVTAVIRKQAELGVGVVLVEQNASIALRTADWAFVMERGSIVMNGAPDVLEVDEGVQAAYLGWS
jgi:branched-chain amino acid transport system ATP-binding protein